ncbi:MAG: heme-binding protein [Burkholderiales bacterium]|nr:heme-binding protein [Burkholderiales bacterium]
MKSIRKSLSVLCVGAVLAVSGAANAADLLDRKAIGLDVAKVIMAAAEAEAKKNNWPVAITIVDEGGHLIAMQKLDNTQYGSIDVSIQKAQTSAGFKRATKVFEDAIAGGRTAILGIEQTLPLEGGLPLIYKGAIIGAIGVSGVTAQQDGIVAKAGADALAAMP